MKQIVKYLSGLILFVGILGGLNAFVSTPMPDNLPAATSVPQSGILSEDTPGSMPSMPEDMLIPASHSAGFAHNVSRIQQIVLRAGFFPAPGYMTHYTTRDYHNNYALIEVRQEALLPYFDPSLEYVFLLRRILI